MTLGSNFVRYPPAGMVLALQFWEADLERTMRLARLLADIEPRRRDDVVMALCRREDIATPPPIVEETWWHCAKKFSVMHLRSARPGAGHPHGCNELMAGVMDALAASWQEGVVRAPSVFLMEGDGCPLSADWIDRLLAEHQDALVHGKRVTGAYTEGTVPTRIPHINGSLIAHLSTWIDRPSLHKTPADEAWDLFHAVALMQEAQSTTLIRNLYGAREWSESALVAMGREAAWLSSTKDDSALAWAERTLVAGVVERRVPVLPGGDRPAGTVAFREHMAAWKRAWDMDGSKGVIEDAPLEYGRLTALLGHRPLTWRPDKNGAPA